MANTMKALGGALDFAKSLQEDPNRSFRKEAMNTELFKGKIIVDTVCAADTKKWETGIEKNGNWIIAEQYGNMNGATKGHEKWVKLLKKNPKAKLKDIDLWGLEEN